MRLRQCARRDRGVRIVVLATHKDIFVGKSLVQKFRPDLGRRFAGSNGDVDAFYDYIYHCNTQTPT